MWHRVWMRKRKLIRQTSYCIGWYGQDGRQRFESVGTNERTAEDRRRRKEMELNSSIAGEPVPISLSAFVQEHLEVTETRVAPGTLTGQRLALQQLSHCIATKRLTDIDHRSIEKFVAIRGKMVKPATVNKEIRTLKAIFNKAVKRGYLRDNPFMGIQMLREPEKAIRILSMEEIAKLLLAAPSLRWRAFIYLALTTGMRLGELCHLEWQDIDLDSGLLTIGNKEGWQTKSRRIRSLGLTREARRLLGELGAGSKRKSSLVFETRDGNPLANNLQRGFRSVVKNAGIKHCTMHDLRRTFVSYLAMAGVNEAVVQRLAGHTSISTTLKHYTHILPESLRRAQECLPYAEPVRPMLTDCGHAQDFALQGKTA